MRALDIVVHASTRPEPFGLVIAEAMACGRAVITSAAGGAAEIVESEVDALTHTPGDVERTGGGHRQARGRSRVAPAARPRARGQRPNDGSIHGRLAAELAGGVRATRMTARRPGGAIAGGALRSSSSSARRRFPALLFLPGHAGRAPLRPRGVVRHLARDPRVVGVRQRAASAQRHRIRRSRGCWRPSFTRPRWCSTRSRARRSAASRSSCSTCSVMAPLFWAGAVVRNADHLARLMTLLLICNGINAFVGVMQVYDPDRWMPQEMSRLVTESEFGLDAVTYHGTERLIVRPAGPLRQPGRRRRSGHVRGAARTRVRDERAGLVETRRRARRCRLPASPRST